VLGVSGFELLADRGYYFGEQVKECIGSEIIPCIPKPNTSVNLKNKMFSKEHLTFSPEETDSYRCPANKTLTYIQHHRACEKHSLLHGKRCPIKKAPAKINF
jgi:hypothetical protein